VELCLGFGQCRKRVDAQQQRPRFFVGHIEDFYFYFHIRVEVATQVAVD
jgi:hypothetical protein